jgi:hypothetical protein
MIRMYLLPELRENMDIWRLLDMAYVAQFGNGKCIGLP